MVLESPELVAYLRSTFEQESKILTRRTGLNTHLDLISGTLKFADGTRQPISIPKVGLAAQEIIVAGGLENWVKKAMKQ